jgi:hypothetical protein
MAWQRASPGELYLLIIKAILQIYGKPGRSKGGY